jgi:hypothetical protein
MGGTWFQWFWRWLVALEFIVFAVGDLEVRIAWSALHAAGLPTMASFSSELVIGAVALGWLTAALIAKALLLVCVPMLVLVELAAWACRRRWRRIEAADRRAIQRAAKQWEREDGRN